VDQNDLESLSAELFDPDMPNVFPATFEGCDKEFFGALSREHIETDEIVGIRSVFTCPTHKIERLQADDPILIGSEQFYARVIECRGALISGLILGK